MAITSTNTGDNTGFAAWNNTDDANTNTAFLAGDYTRDTARMAFEEFGAVYRDKPTISNGATETAAGVFTFGEGDTAETVYGGQFISDRGQPISYFMHNETASDLLALIQASPELQAILEERGISPNTLTASDMADTLVMELLHGEGIIGINDDGRVYIPNKTLDNYESEGLELSKFSLEDPDSQIAEGSTFSNDQTHYLVNNDGEVVPISMNDDGTYMARVTDPYGNQMGVKIDPESIVFDQNGKMTAASWQDGGVTQNGTRASDQEILRYQLDTYFVPGGQMLHTDDAGAPGLWVYQDNDGEWKGQPKDANGNDVDEPSPINGFTLDEKGGIFLNYGDNQVTFSSQVDERVDAGLSAPPFSLDKANHTGRENGIPLNSAKSEGLNEASNFSGDTAAGILYYDQELEAWVIEEVDANGNPFNPPKVHVASELVPGNDEKGYLSIIEEGVKKTFGPLADGIEKANEPQQKDDVNGLANTVAAYEVLGENYDEVDSIRTEGKTDGIISKGDIEAWRDRYKDDHSPEGRAKYEAAQTILDTWENNPGQHKMLSVGGNTGAGDDKKFNREEFDFYSASSASIYEYYSENPGQIKEDLRLYNEFIYIDTDGKGHEGPQDDNFYAIARAGDGDELSDKHIEMEDLEAAASNPSNPAHKIAKKLLELFERNPGLFDALAGPDGKISWDDAKNGQNFLTSLR